MSGQNIPGRWADRRTKSQRQSVFVSKTHGEGPDTQGSSSKTGSDLFNKSRTREQCYLIRNIATFNKKAIQGDAARTKPTNIPYHVRSTKRNEFSQSGGSYMFAPYNFCTEVEGKSATTINALNGSTGPDQLLQIRPHVLARLVPEIRLFKKYPRVKDASAAAMDINDYIDLEIPFSTYYTKEHVFSKSKGVSGPGDGAGIKSVSILFNGTNPFEARHSIEFKLSLYLADFGEMIKTRATYFDKELNKEFKVMLADLLARRRQHNPPNPDAYKKKARDPNDKTKGYDVDLSPSNKPRPSKEGYPPHEEDHAVMSSMDVIDFFRIKAIVGWASPGEASLNDLVGGQELARAIATSRLILDLVLRDHEISFNQDGSCTLNITYVATLEGIMKEQRNNVISAGTSLLKSVAQEEKKKAEMMRNAAEYRKNNPLKKNFFEEHTLWDQDYLGSTSPKDRKENMEKFKRDLDNIKSASLVRNVGSFLKHFFDTKSKSMFFAEFTYAEARAYFSPEVDNPKYGGFSMFLERANFASDGFMAFGNKSRATGRGRYTSGGTTADPDAPITQLSQEAKDAGFSDIDHWNEFNDHPKVYQLRGSDFEGEMGFGNTTGGSKYFPQGRIGKLLEKITKQVDNGENSNELRNQTLNFGLQSIVEAGYEAKDKSGGDLIPGTAKNSGKVDTDYGYGANSDENAIRYRLFFTYLGDIIDAAIHKSFINFTDALGGDGTLNKLNKDAASRIERYKSIRYLLGEFEYLDPSTKEITTCNIADIPVSFPKFVDWIFDKTINKKKFTWPLWDFVRDIVNDLAVTSLGRNCFSEGAPSAAARFGMSNHTLYKKRLTGQGNDFQKWKYDSYFPVDNTGINPIPEHYVRKYGLVAKHNSRWSAALPHNATEPAVYMYVRTVAPKNRVGDFEHDYYDNVWHLWPGADRGLLKKISYKRQDQQFLREASIEKQTAPASTEKSYALAEGLSLREVYNCSLEMYGNTLFYPGTIFFVDPSKTGSPFFSINADPKTKSVDIVNEKLALATNLGIKGYYMANKVEHVIERGKYEVLVDGIYVYDGVPRPAMSMGGMKLTDLHRSMANMLVSTRSTYSGQQLKLFDAVNQLYATIYNRPYKQTGGPTYNPTKGTNALSINEQSLFAHTFGGKDSSGTQHSGLTPAQAAALTRDTPRWYGKVQ